MRIAISAGHNVYINNVFDPGAVGNGKREADITKETVKLLVPALANLGHSVLDVTPYNQKFTHSKESHKHRTTLADNFKADVFIDVHVNAGGGTGAEAWIYGKGGRAEGHAKNIVNSLANNLGLRNRGVKVNPKFWSLSLGKAPAVIVEGAFIDSASDMQKLTPLNYADAILKAFNKNASIIDKPKEEAAKVDINKPSEWARETWEDAIKKGYTDGLRPRDNITREETMAMIYKTLKLKKG